MISGSADASVGSANNDTVNCPLRRDRACLSWAVSSNSTKMEKGPNTSSCSSGFSRKTFPVVFKIIASPWLLPFDFSRVRANTSVPACVKAWSRSEEHTSELQSRENIVCRLLLEKKKEKLNRQNTLKSGRRVRVSHGEANSLRRAR